MQVVWVWGVSGVMRVGGGVVVAVFVFASVCMFSTVMCKF